MADIILSWQDVEILVAKMARHIQESKQFFTGVIGVARGGVIPAVLLAGALGIRGFHTTQCVKYVDRKNIGVQYEPVLPRFYPGGTYLVMDDIVGTGETLQAIERTRKDRRDDLQFVYAALIARAERPLSPTLPFVGRIISDDDGWVVFPWETNRKTEG